MRKISGKFLKIMRKYHPLFLKNYGKRQIKNYGQRSKQAKMYQKHQIIYPLSGKLYCEKHKCGFVRKIRHYKEKKDIIFWYCSDFHKTGRKNCVPACFKEEDLYNILLSIFKSYEVYKEEICEELLCFYKDVSNLKEDIKEETKLQEELTILEKKKDKLLDLALDGLLSKEELSKKKVIIEKQINQIKSNLKDLEDKKVHIQEREINNKILKEKILKELVITRDNLENYIEELLDKIIVMENAELKIILAGEKIINRGSHQNSMKISHLVKNEKTDYKKLPLCHSHAHG